MGESQTDPEVVLCFMFFALLVGCITTYLLSRFAPGLKYTVVLFVEGILLALCVDYFGFLVLGQSIDEWISIDPQLLLFVFLPALLFGESMGLNIHDVKLTLTSSLLLAGPGSIFGTLVLAQLSKAVLPYGWSMNLCNVLGAILCATDPVAVVALLKEVGAAPRITMLVTQEALLNDGAALVLYNLYFTSLKTVGSNAFSSGGSIVLYFIKVIIISPLLGLALGMGTCMGFGLTNQHTSHSDVVVQVALSLVCAYFSFFIAEYFVGVSGVISCMCSGIVISARAPTLILEKEMMHNVWSTFEWIGNTLIFLLAGLLFGHAVISMVNVQNCTMVLYIYLILLGIRTFMVFASYPILRRGVYGLGWRECLFLSWGGLRGAVGMALGLSLVRSAEQGEINVSISDAHRMFFIVGGVVTLTLVVNAMTASWALAALKLVEEKSPAIQVMQHYARKRIYQALVQLFLNLKDEMSSFDPKVVAALTTAGLKQLGYEDGDSGEQPASGDHGLQYAANTSDDTARALFSPCASSGDDDDDYLAMASFGFNVATGGVAEEVKDSNSVVLLRRKELLGLYDSSLQQHGYRDKPSGSTDAQGSEDDDDIELRTVIGDAVTEAASVAVGVAREAAGVVGDLGAATLNPLLRLTRKDQASDDSQSSIAAEGAPSSPKRVDHGEGTSPSTPAGSFLLSPERLSALMDGLRLQTASQGAHKAGQGSGGSQLKADVAALPLRTEIDPALLVQVRVAFLEVLRGVYWQHISSGRLPRTSSAALMLLASVDYGRDTVTTTTSESLNSPMHDGVGDDQSSGFCRSVEPMGDWLHLQPQLHHPAKWLRWVCAKIDKASASTSKWEASPDTGVGADLLLYRTDLTGALREWHAGTSIYILASHIRAHEQARQVICRYLGETELADTPEEKHVIAESISASTQASAMLAAIDRRVVSYHAARQLTKILSKTKEHVIMEFAAMGVIREKDAEVLLEEARKQKDHSRSAWLRSLFHRSMRSGDHTVQVHTSSHGTNHQHASVSAHDPDA